MSNLQADYSANVVSLKGRVGDSAPPGPPLPPVGGEPPDDGKVQVRLAVLEIETRTIREILGEMKAEQKTASKDLNDIKIAIARIEGDMRHRPTYKEAIALVSGMLLLMGLLIVFQGYIQKYVGPSFPVGAVSPPQKL